jgi:bacillolysin
MNNLENLIKKLRTRDPKVAITLNPEQSAISIIRGNLAAPVSATELRKAPHEHARRFIRENKSIVGEIDEAKELIDERAMTDRRGMTHVVFQQKHGDAVVLGGTLSVHYGADGAMYLIKSNLASAKDVEKKPKTPADRAVEIAKQHAGEGASLFPRTKPVLVVADANTLHQQGKRQRYYLCWQMELITPEDKQSPGWIYFIDAMSDKVLLRYPAIRTGSGSGGYSSSHDPNLNSETSGSTHRLRDTTTSSGWSVTTKPVVHTFDDNGSTSFTLTNYSEDPDDNWDNGGVIPPNRKDDQRPEVDIHRYLGFVLDYYFFTHGHNGWNAAGKDAKGHAHNEYLSNNAFWYGAYQQVYFADGNGTTRDFMCPLDTVAHEFNHGVKYYFNILQTYSGETGALDEATSDLFGAFVALDYATDDPWPWLHGRQYRLDGTVGRNMIDPSRDAAGVVQYDATSNATKAASCQNGFYPDHYSIRYTGASDNHGVHWNCPIITHAVYLMINGGTHRLSNVTVTGIGVAAVEQMLFEVISTPGLLDNASDFADFRLAFIEACQTLYPENLDYLATVKTAFHAVGIGPDLYIRDRLADQGEEPGILSCMSPDIILRRQQADAATLTLIGDLNNASLCEDIELGATPHDHYVYFRIFNRGAVPASGTLRLFISPVSTFPTPSTWHEVGHYDFPNISAAGGSWVPTAGNQCITLSATLINTLGLGHYCFIGIIESTDDPEPDRALIDNVSEFHAFISKSNNYAWRNCDIVPGVSPDESGEFSPIARAFQINGFGRKFEPRDLEIDTRDLPDGTQLVLWIPDTRFFGLKAFEVRPAPARVRVAKIAGTLGDLPVGETPVLAVPMTQLATVREIEKMIPQGMKAKELAKWRPLCVSPAKLIRLAGLTPSRDEKVDVRFVVKFPRNAGTRDVTLAFRERGKDGALGQMNYIFKIRKGRI